MRKLTQQMFTKITKNKIDEKADLAKLVADGIKGLSAMQSIKTQVAKALH